MRTIRFSRMLCIACVLAVLLMFPLTISAQAATSFPCNLTVATTTRVSGQFFTDMWGNNATDIDVRHLLHDYPTVSWTSGGTVVMNDTVVEKIDISDVLGGRRYTFTLYPDMVYNDGTPITAKDYVFSVLLQSSPAVAALGGSITNMDHLVGYMDYVGGELEAFRGVNLINDYTFSLTIDEAFLPYYYELASVAVNPYPISVIAPNCDIVDEGDGAIVLGDFSSKVLQKTLFEEETGYMSFPRVTSGPYQLQSYNVETGTVKFTINPNYLGNYEYQKPSVQSIALVEITSDQIIEKLENGTVDIVSRVSEGTVADTVQSKISNKPINLAPYPRTGLSFIAYSCEYGITQSQTLRQAIAYCVQSESICQSFLQNHGNRVYGFYGNGLWMVDELGDRVNELKTYDYDVEQAAILLEEDGWIYNEKGNAYTHGVDTLRYRQNEQGKLEPLTLRMAVTEDNAAASEAVSLLLDGFSAVGIDLQVDTMPFPQLLEHYYRQTDRDYNLLFLASNFTQNYDPYITFSTADEYQGVINTSGLQDERLETLALEMRETVQGNVNIYLNKWMEFQKYFNEVLPLFPMYSNTYFDIYNNRVSNYYPDNTWSWSTAILYVQGVDADTYTPVMVDGKLMEFSKSFYQAIVTLGRQSKINLREKPTQNGGYTGVADKGSSVTILRQEGEWAWVVTESGNEGYIRNEYLTLDNSDADIVAAIAVAADGTPVTDSAEVTIPSDMTNLKPAEEAAKTDETAPAVEPEADATDKTAEPYAATITLEKQTKIYLRAEADQKAKSMGLANKNSVVTVQRVEGEWAWVTTESGKEGYVRTAYLTPVQPTDEQQPEPAPEADAAAKPDETTPVAEPEADAVAAEELAGLNTATITLENQKRIILRAEANQKAESTGQANKNSVVTVQRVEGEWAWVITKNGQEGYVRTAYLTPTQTADEPKADEAGAAASEETTALYTATITLENQNRISLRAEADQKASSTGYANKNSVVTVQRVEGEWAWVTTKNGKEGYVRIAYLTQ